MKIDTYTKIILTIIALCLVINVLKDETFIASAHASETIKAPKATSDYMLVPVNEASTLDVRIVDINTYDELNVNIKSVDAYDELKVNVTSIDTNDELDVNIDEIGGSFVSSGGPLPVTTN